MGWGKEEERRKSMIDSSSRRSKMMCTGGLMMCWFNAIVVELRFLPRMIPCEGISKELPPNPF